jgi:hypothetical protein
MQRRKERHSSIVSAIGGVTNPIQFRLQALFVLQANDLVRGTNTSYCMYPNTLVVLTYSRPQGIKVGCSARPSTVYCVISFQLAKQKLGLIRTVGISIVMLNCRVSYVCAFTDNTKSLTTCS